MASHSDTEESERHTRHAGLPARFKDYELSNNLSKKLSGAEASEDVANSKDFHDIGPIPHTPKDKIDVTVSALEKENELLANELKLQQLLLTNKKLKEEL